MSGGLSAGAFTAAAISTAATVASTAYTIASSGAKATGDLAKGEVGNAASSALSARSALLETAGGAAGDPLAPGQVSKGAATLFGN